MATDEWRKQHKTVDPLYQEGVGAGEANRGVEAEQ